MLNCAISLVIETCLAEPRCHLSNASRHLVNLLRGISYITRNRPSTLVFLRALLLDDFWGVELIPECCWPSEVSCVQDWGTFGTAPVLRSKSDTLIITFRHDLIDRETVEKRPGKWRYRADKQTVLVRPWTENYSSGTLFDYVCWNCLKLFKSRRCGRTSYYTLNMMISVEETVIDGKLGGAVDV